jgi:hypothetical protein
LFAKKVPSVIRSSITALANCFGTNIWEWSQASNAKAAAPAPYFKSIVVLKPTVVLPISASHKASNRMTWRIHRDNSGQKQELGDRGCALDVSFRRLNTVIGDEWKTVKASPAFVDKKRTTVAVCTNAINARRIDMVTSAIPTPPRQVSASDKSI